MSARFPTALAPSEYSPRTESYSKKHIFRGCPVVTTGGLWVLNLDGDVLWESDDMIGVTGVIPINKSGHTIVAYGRDVVGDLGEQCWRNM